MTATSKAVRKKSGAWYCRPILFAFVALWLLGREGRAQSGNDRQGWGYAFAAPGIVDSTPTLHIGGGGESLLYKGFGVGAELGYLGPFEAFNGGLGILSINGGYHFGKSKSGQKWVPFVTGGYSLAFRKGVANLANIGGGVNYWFKDRVGLRLEFRDHIFTPGGTNVYNFRVGFTFR
jgi:hypothetical protein